MQRERRGGGGVVNTMYLVCVHHPDKADAFVLASRAQLHEYCSAHLYAPALHKWFAAHKHCGGGFDHFTIAYDQVKDHDLPKPAPLANGVHLALREAANEP